MTPRSPVTPLRLFALLVALSAVTRVLLLLAPPLSDEPVHMIGSWIVLRGGQLYVDFVDNKPPLLYAYYAFAQWLGGPGILGVRVLTVFVTVPLTAMAASAFYRHTPAGVTASVLYVLTGASFLVHEGLAVNTEVLMLLPAALAFTVLQRMRGLSHRHVFVAGALLGVAALFKVTALVWAPAAPLMAWRLSAPHRKWREAGLAACAVTAGVAVPVTLTLGYFAWRGAAVEMLTWAVLRNFAYVSAPIGAVEALRRAARGALAWTVATAPLWWAATTRQRGEPIEDSRWLARWLVILALPAAVLGFRFFAHYYLQVLLPLCLAAGPVVASLTRRPLPRAARVGAAWLGLAWAAFMAVNAWLLFVDNRVIESRRPLYRDVSNALRQDPCFPGATSLFVWGREPLLYTETQLAPASRFVLPPESISGYVAGRDVAAKLDLSSPATMRSWDLLKADLRRSNPTYILDASFSGSRRSSRFRLWQYPALFLYLRDGYDVTDHVSGVVIYRRKGCATPTSS